MIDILWLVNQIYLIFLQSQSKSSLNLSIQQVILKTYKKIGVNYSTPILISSLYIKLILIN